MDNPTSNSSDTTPKPAETPAAPAPAPTAVELTDKQLDQVAGGEEV